MKKDKVKQEWDEHRASITRNHVIYAKRCLREMAAEHGWELPDEYYLQTPLPEAYDGEGNI